MNFERKYVSVIYDQETQENMREWCETNGFDISLSFSGNKINPADFGFHTTIFYTTSRHFIYNKVITLPEFTVKPVSLALIGKQNDIVVLDIASTEIQAIRSLYETKYDMRDEWPVYRPHVSVCYDKKKRDLTDLMGIEMPKFPLKTRKMIIDHGS